MRGTYETTETYFAMSCLVLNAPFVRIEKKVQIFFIFFIFYVIFCRSHALLSFFLERISLRINPYEIKLFFVVIVVVNVHLLTYTVKEQIVRLLNGKFRRGEQRVEKRYLWESQLLYRGTN